MDDNGKAPGSGGPIAAATSGPSITALLPLAHALAYASRGWRVIWAPPGIKRPTVAGWQHTATTDTAVVTSWFAGRPDLNVCVVTGEQSGIFVLDVDDKPGKTGSATLAALERAHGDLPVTYSVGTGSGGVHHYFRWPGFNPGNSAGRLGKDLDIRAEGGQVVAPPSRADDQDHFMAYFVLLNVAVAAAPEWLLDLFRPVTRPSVGATHGYQQPASPDGLLRWLAGVQPGGQDDALNWSLWKLHGEGVPSQHAGEQVWPVVAAWECSREPWTVRQVQDKIRRIWGAS